MLGFIFLAFPRPNDFALGFAGDIGKERVEASFRRDYFAQSMICLFDWTLTGIRSTR